jgi:PPP family 3-phenylpropionic acid transporter
MAATSLIPLKRQYFLAYAIMGSLMPFMAVFLKQKGFEETQIGSALGASQIAVLLTPVVLALLADTKFESRYIMATVFAVSSLAVAGLYFTGSFWPILLCLCLQSLAYIAVLPLLDALNFAVHQEQSEQGKSATPYHRIRVWGTIGFILPGALIFVLLYRGFGINGILFSGILFGVLGALNALRLPSPPCAPPAKEECPARQSKLRQVKAHLPTAQAARALRRPPVLVFCLSMFLTSMGSAAFGAFFPLYLTDVVGVAQHWIAPITNVGVVFEIFFMLGFGWFLSRWGFKRLIIAGMLCMTLRMLTLAMFPSTAVAVGTQLIHGMVVLATTVAPVMYLNQQASDTDRNSIQGLYTMAIAGTSRMAGSFLAGYVAKVSLTTVFLYSSVLTFAAACLLLFAFHEELIPQAAES